MQLIEYGSMTCPHCREFDETGVQPLIDNYVKSGKVGFEFRNYVRDPFDLTATLVARCNGAKTFFPLTRALYKDQPKWIAKVQQLPPAQIESLQGLPPSKQFVELAKLAGFPQYAAVRGVPLAKTNQCLANETAINELVAMSGQATTDFPDFPGTPTFILNGEMRRRRSPTGRRLRASSRLRWAANSARGAGRSCGSSGSSSAGSRASSNRPSCASSRA